jgi:hypothetical protein
MWEEERGQSQRNLGESDVRERITTHAFARPRHFAYHIYGNVEPTGIKSVKIGRKKKNSHKKTASKKIGEGREIAEGKGYPRE